MTQAPDPAANEKPNCRECRHRRNVLGSAHSSCAHPSVAAVAESPLGQILGIMGKRAGPVHGPLPLGVTGNAHGIRHGWFNWPFNFDPLWLQSCDGFEVKS